MKDPITGFRIGFLKEGFEKVEPSVRATVEATKEVFESLGAKVEWVSIPEHYDGNTSFFICLVL